MKPLKILKTLCWVCTFSFLTSYGFGQNVNKDIDQWFLKERRMNITSLCQHPAGTVVAIAASGGEPVMIYNVAERKIIREIPVFATPRGYALQFSATGKYLLAQERRISFLPMKSLTTQHLVIDVETGQVVRDLGKLADAKITPDEQFVFTLYDNTVSRINVQTGETVTQFEVQEATNAIGLSSDGKQVLVSHRPTKEQLEQIPYMRNDKKNIKPALKYRQMVSAFDAETGSRMYLVPEIYDIVNQIYNVPASSRAYIFSLPSAKVNAVGYQGYVNMINLEDGQPLRESYSSLSPEQPAMQYEPSQHLFGISSTEKFPVLNIYDAATGTMVEQFDTRHRTFAAAETDGYKGSVAAFTFLPEPGKILVGYGNTLTLWTLKSN